MFIVHIDSREKHIKFARVKPIFLEKQHKLTFAHSYPVLLVEKMSTINVFQHIDSKLHMVFCATEDLFPL